jgi:hypothetical protein
MPSVASESQGLLRNRAAYIGRAKHVSGNANQYQNAAGIQQSKATTATNKTATNKTTTFCFFIALASLLSGWSVSRTRLLHKQSRWADLHALPYVHMKQASESKTAVGGWADACCTTFGEAGLPFKNVSKHRRKATD